jgi:hypothetical protein
MKNKEVYREINDYWCRRLLEVDEETEWDIWQELIEDLANPNRKHEDVYECLSFYGVRFKHKGIEIRNGNPEWGAEPNKLYFVIVAQRYRTL